MGKWKKLSRQSNRKRGNRIKRKRHRQLSKVRTLATRLARKRRMQRDPGVPRLFPEKMQMLKDAQRERIRIRVLDERQARKEHAQAAASESLAGQQQELFRLEMTARLRLRHFTQRRAMIERAQELASENREISSAVTSTSRFFRDLKKVVQASDVLLEILDARDPLGCRAPSLERQILSDDPNKRIVLVLNKIDLVPQEVVSKWLEYLRRELPTIPFKASTQRSGRNANVASANFDGPVNAAPASLRHGGRCLGRGNLLSLLKNYCRISGMGGGGGGGGGPGPAPMRSITVGVIGFPNVGKSSVINSLKGRRVAGVGAQPGMTTDVTTFRMDRNIQFMDCPGIIFESQRAIDRDLLLRNCVRIDTLEDPVGPVHIICMRCSPERLQRIYGLTSFTEPDEFLQLVAHKFGMFLKGGLPNVELAARRVLRDWNQGRIPFYTLPPSRPPPLLADRRTPLEDDAAMVEWGVVDDGSVLNKIISLRERKADLMIPMLSSLTI